MKVEASKKEVIQRKPLQHILNVLPPKKPSLKHSASNRPLQSKPKPLPSASSHRKRYSVLLQVPPVSSKHWCVYDAASGSCIEGFRDQQQVEVASLTKIMTLIVSLRLLERFNIPVNQIATVSKFAASTTGTTASLTAGDRLSIWDLFFGLMLPSGNDASVVLAEHIGQSLDPSKPREMFIGEMNALAQELGMTLSLIHI